MTTKYFSVPFANAGDKTSIPDASQPSGDVSFQDGWTPDYAKDQSTDATAKDVPRQSENYFKFVISEALKEIQEMGSKPYDPLVNYPIGAVIPGSDNIRYECQVANGPASSVVDPVGDATDTWIKYFSLVPSLISGIVPSNDTDANHDVTISPGICVNHDTTVKMQLKTALTKRIDATWAAGDNAGGLFSGSVAADTTYYMFLIKKNSDASIDAGWDADINASNIPAGYTAYRMIDAIITDASANILPWIEKELCGGGIRKIYKSAILSFSGTPGAGVRTTHTMEVPTGLNVLIHISAHVVFIALASNIWIGETDQIDAVVGISGLVMFVQTGAEGGSIVMDVLSDTNGQIGYRNLQPVTAVLRTRGYTLNRA